MTSPDKHRYPQEGNSTECYWCGAVPPCPRWQHWVPADDDFNPFALEDDCDADD
jgi:hypothetical protein